MAHPLTPSGSFEIPNNTYPPGRVTTPLRSANTLEKIGFYFDVTNHTNPAVTVRITIEQSVNGGIDWEPLGGLTRVGGPLSAGPDGILTTECAMSLSFPIKTTRSIRANAQITGGSLITSGALWWI